MHRPLTLQPARADSAGSASSTAPSEVSFATECAFDEFQPRPRTSSSSGARDASLKYSSLAVFLLGTVGDQVLIKRSTYAANFPSALTLLTALLGVVVYPLVVLAAVLSGRVAWDQVKVPWWKPAVVAFCFSLHHTLLNAGAGGKAVPGVFVSVLVKLVVPISMFLNMPLMTLGLRYKGTHWAGLAVLLLGILITVGGRFGDAPVQWSATGNMVLIVVSTIPLAASFTFIEVQLKQVHPNLFAVALWMWICLFMSGISIALLPLNAVFSHVQFTRMFADLGEGMSCYVLGSNPLDPQDEDCKDGHCDCASASLSWWLAMMFTLMYNMAMPVSTRYGGAALMWFVRALTVPLTGLLFAMPWLMGEHAKSLSVAQMFGLLIVMLGVALFNVQEPSERLAKELLRVRDGADAGLSLSTPPQLPIVAEMSA